MDLSRFAGQKLPEPIQRVLAAGLDAVDPERVVRTALRREGQTLWCGETAYPLRKYQRIVLIGFGKAAVPMTCSVMGLLNDCDVSGLVITKEGHLAGKTSCAKVEFLEAAHPIPDERGVQHTRKILSLVRDMQADDLVICLISGGGSALLTAPVEGVLLEDFRSLTDLLLRSGADIQQLNIVRKHLDAVKGGGLARAVFPAQLITLVLSDVLGDDPGMIASGPTVPDTSTFAQAWAVLEKYGLLQQVPSNVAAYLRAGALGKKPETLKAGDPIFERMRTRVIASNIHAASAAAHQAKLEGFHTQILTTHLQGEARQAGQFLAAIAQQFQTECPPLKRPACLILGGETTVTVHGNGLGGRNQELALGAVAGLADLPGVLLVTLATDGGDGPTDAAGAIVTGETLARGQTAGLDVNDFLNRNDAYHYFDLLGNLLRTGPTQTNVNDLTLLFVF